MSPHTCHMQSAPIPASVRRRHPVTPAARRRNRRQSRRFTPLADTRAGPDQLVRARVLFEERASDLLQLAGAAAAVLEVHPLERFDRDLPQPLLGDALFLGHEETGGVARRQGHRELVIYPLRPSRSMMLSNRLVIFPTS